VKSKEKASVNERHTRPYYWKVLECIATCYV